MEALVSCCGFVPQMMDTWDTMGHISFCDQVTLNWRESVMLAGIAIVVAGVAIAILSGEFFLATCLAISGCVIGFGGYHVARYMELASMREQLGELKRTNKALEGNVSSLQGTADLLKIECDRIDQEYTNFKGANEKLALTNAQLSLAAQKLDLLHQEIGKHEQTLNTTVLKQVDAQTRLDATTESLASTERSFRVVLASLESVTKDLQAAAEAFKGNAPVYERLSSLISAIAPKTPISQ